VGWHVIKLILPMIRTANKSFGIEVQRSEIAEYEYGRAGRGHRATCGFIAGGRSAGFKNEPEKDG
jgi:hypothetical protein